MPMEPSISNSPASISTDDYPFNLPPKMTSNGLKYLTLKNEDFFKDRIRHVDWLLHKNDLINAFLNKQKIQEVPESEEEEETFVFFVDLDSVDLIDLQMDSLSPWSGMERTVNRAIDTPFEVDDSSGVIKILPAGSESKFIHHEYTKNHSENPELFKRTIYLMNERRPFGIALIMYRYSLREVRDVISRQVFEKDLRLNSHDQPYVTVLEYQIEEKLLKVFNGKNKSDAIITTQPDNESRWIIE
uniref:DUF4821 domain-containing protein n=2 Tax=Caenorhabditis tropicalis TaxID=1561998 RepID=A0A1I7UDS1_9PELO